MNINTIVSVIIPTYNRGKFIGAAIQSVLDQDYSAVEIIVVDDGSTDETRSVVRRFGESVKYVYQPNHGRSNARNRALEMSVGRYIAFLDSDDLYLAGKLKLQVEYMERHPEFGMIYTSARCMDENGDSLPAEYMAMVSGSIYREIAFYVPVTIALPTVMVRHEVFHVVGCFDEKMERFEDTDMWRRISKHCLIGAMSNFTCELRTHQANTLRNQDPRSIIEALDYYVAKVTKEDVDMSICVRRRGISGLYRYYGEAFLTVTSWQRLAYLLLLRGLWAWPLNYEILRILKNKLWQKVRNSMGGRLNASEKKK